MVFQKKTPCHGDEPRKRNSETVCNFPSSSCSSPSTFTEKHKLFCTMFSVSALDSGSPDHLRIALHPSGNCSHLPDHCHPHCQVQAFTKHHQQPPCSQPRAYGTALEHMEAFQQVKFTGNISFPCSNSQSREDFHRAVGAVVAGNFNHLRQPRLFPCLDKGLIKVSSG